MNKKTIRAIFLAFQKANPHPKTELQYHNHFELLIAVMLSAQATDKSVNKVTPVLFALAPTPEKMTELGLTRVKELIRSIGLYATKAKNILATSHLLIGKFKSRVPATREELESLPGVGRKTANVILNTCFGLPTIAVDTHIFRVANRTGLAKGKTPLAVENELVKEIPPEFLLNAHHWLVLHGRYVCTARKPHCPTCIIKKYCEYPDKTRAE